MWNAVRTEERAREGASLVDACSSVHRLTPSQAAHIQPQPLRLTLHAQAAPNPLLPPPLPTPSTSPGPPHPPCPCACGRGVTAERVR